MGQGNQVKPPASEPVTDRGRRTQRKLLEAATAEFGERGYHDTSISEITRRAGVALGTFYTYFDSKDAIFRALVRDFSHGVKEAAARHLSPDLDALEGERAALFAFLEFAREHKEIYRIIDEAEFVDPASYRTHYETTAARIADRLRAGSQSGEFRPDIAEAHAWAVMGMNVFLGLRYAVWGSEQENIGDVADIANSILASGLACQSKREAQ